MTTKMKPKPTLNARFNKSANELFELSTDRVFLSVMGVAGLLIYVFDQEAALRVAAAPALLCGVGAVYKGISSLIKK